MNKEISRRSFFKISTAAICGFATGEALISTLPYAVHVLEDNTNMEVGNAYMREKLERNDYVISTADKIHTGITAPILEEIEYRAIPSVIVSDIKDENGLDVAFYGKRNLGMTRREIIGGTISTLVFSAMHNVTDTKIDTKTIPASQAVSGAIFWYLQRKLGIISNTVAHMVVNSGVFRY
jgi:hypothetical protein